jgi:hypothetical protein
MPSEVPLRPSFEADVLHDKEGNPIDSVLSSGVRRLAVDAELDAGDIQIGAVELDDGEGSTRASIKPSGDAVGGVGNDGGLMVAGNNGGTQRHVAVDADGHVVVSQINTALQNVEEVAVLGGADFFTSPAVAPRDGVFLVEFVGDTAGVLSLEIVRDTTTRLGALEKGEDLVADAWYSWDFPCKSGDEANLQFSVDSQVTAMISFQEKS